MLADSDYRLVQWAGSRRTHAVDARHGSAWHCTARPHSTARHGKARHGTARHGTARHGTAHRGLAAMGGVDGEEDLHELSFFLRENLNGVILRSRQPPGTVNARGSDTRRG